jgi:hypothetical protein
VWLAFNSVPSCASRRGQMLSCSGSGILLSPPIEIIESDVTHFLFRGDETVFFLYNPFTPVVLAQTLQNIAFYVSAVPRAIWLIYNTPLHHHTICEDGRFERSELLEIDGTDFRVYSQFKAAIPQVDKPSALQLMIAIAQLRPPSLGSCRVLP